MKRFYILFVFCGFLLFTWNIISCNDKSQEKTQEKIGVSEASDSLLFYLDTTKIPKGRYGDLVRYGRELMLQTAYLIGPDGLNGDYLGNKMNCTNCHEDEEQNRIHLIFRQPLKIIPNIEQEKAKFYRWLKGLIIASCIRILVTHYHWTVKK